MWKHVVLAVIIIPFSRCIENKEIDYEEKDSTRTEQGNSENTGITLKYIKYQKQYINTNSNENISESKTVTDLIADEDSKGEEMSTTDTFIETTRTWIAFHNYTDINVTDTETNNKSDEIQDICSKFKKVSSKFNISEMVDKWQTLYHVMPERVPCFKIYIRRTTPKERVKYTIKYGTFNETVDWDKCYLEIRASTPMTRKHFLEVDNDDGVLENVILDKVTEAGQTQYTLVDEIADQWLVSKNILLMRDCETGGVMAYSRAYYEPSLQEIKEALVEFGEDRMNGTITCSNYQAFDMPTMDTDEDFDT